VPKIFVLEDSKETINAVFESDGTFRNLFSTASDKYELGKSLLDSFVASSSVDAKNKLAQWLKNLDQASVLKELKRKDVPSNEDLEILRAQFPSVKILKQMQDSREIENGASSATTG
jgi:hypothetical protein